MGSFCFLEKNEEIEIVKIGFSWKPFLFTFFWGLSQNLWIYSVSWYLFTLIFFSFSMAYSIIDLNILIIFILISCFFWGFFGNSILINDLIRNKSFYAKKIIPSSSLTEAILVYYSEK